jgi:hypothetical protein
MRAVAPRTPSQAIACLQEIGLKDSFSPKRPKGPTSFPAFSHERSNALDGWGCR